MLLCIYVTRRNRGTLPASLSEAADLHSTTWVPHCLMLRALLSNAAGVTMLLVLTS